MAARRPPGRGGQTPSRKPRFSQAPKAGAGRPRRSQATAAPGRARSAPRSPARNDELGLERLNKILARAGLGSRRAVEEYILQGRVTVNGEVVRDLSSRFDPDAVKIELDGEPLRLESFVYYAVNKPKGYMSTNDDPAGRPRVVDLLPELPQRVYTVGRLDENSTGLILLTNDGELANRLTHPRYGVEKVYHALVAGSPDPAVIQKLVEGVWLAEGKARAKRARVLGKRGDATLLEIVLSEGKNREVRRMLAKLGHKVMNLTRVAVGPISVKGLQTGTFRRLTAKEVGLLRQLAEGIPVPTAISDPGRDRRAERGTQGRGTRGQARADAARTTAAAGSTTRPPRPTGPRAGTPSSTGETTPPPRPMGPRGGRPATGGVARPPRPTGPRADRAGSGGAAGAVRPPRPTGPRASTPAGSGSGLPARPMGPRAGSRPPGRASGPPPRSSGAGSRGARPPHPPVEDLGQEVIPGPLGETPTQRRVIGMPAGPAGGGRRPGPRPTGPRRRPPRAAGPGGPTGPGHSATPGVPKKRTILRRPRRTRPGEES